MCKFCNSMKVFRQCDEILKKSDPDLEHRYSVAIITRTFRKGQRGCRGSSMDARYNGCGFELNYCPECGQKITKKEV